MINKNQVERFVQDVLFIDEEKGEILFSLRNIILQLSPNAQEEIKYGGLVFNIDSELICGIFILKKHIFLEFSFGMIMSDPDRNLEGKGKYRRHLKVYSKKDIGDKKVELYIEQAFKVKC